MWWRGAHIRAGMALPLDSWLAISNQQVLDGKTDGHGHCIVSHNTDLMPTLRNAFVYGVCSDVLKHFPCLVELINSELRMTCGWKCRGYNSSISVASNFAWYRNGAVDIAIQYGLYDPRFESHWGQMVSSLTYPSKSNLGPPSFLYNEWALFSWVKQPGREVRYPTPCSTEVKND
jgi:hypothetical protein